MKHYFSDHYFVSSQLEADYQEKLEELIYFNRNQSRIRGALSAAVDRYGSPRIGRHGDYLTLKLATIPQVQALYVFRDGRRPGLVGVAVYALEGPLLRMIFVGIDPRHTYKAGQQDYLLVNLIEIMRGIGRKIRGVTSVEFTNGNRIFRLAV